MKTVKFKQWDCIIEVVNYAYGGKCIKLIDSNDHEPIATATSWIPDTNEDELAIKDYSENQGMYKCLLEADIITPAHRFIDNGFVGFPIVYLK